jgi:hypothetical protein
MDWVRKFSNGTVWDPWLGNVATCFNPITNIETGRGYEYYGNPGNGITPTGIYAFYGDFNTQNSATGFTIKLPVTSLGWNFVGNPYPSAITFGEPSGGSTAGPGWFWDKQYTNPVAYWFDNAIGIYRYWDWKNGLGNGPNEAAPFTYKRTIPRSQGFFVDVFVFSPSAPLAGPSGSDVAIDNTARVFRSDRAIGKSSGVLNYMNVALKDASGKYIDDAIINFRDDANGTEFNRESDARKMYNDVTGASQLYFRTTDNVDVALKTLKLETGNVMYPLNLKVLNTGTYSVGAEEMSFSANTGVLLKDNKTNTTVDLKVNPVYTFTATAGDDDARFSLYFTDVLYGINNLTDNTFKVYSYDNSIYIQNNDLKSIAGTVLVYDMIGKQMMQEN